MIQFNVLNIGLQYEWQQPVALCGWQLKNISLFKIDFIFYILFITNLIFSIFPNVIWILYIIYKIQNVCVGVSHIYYLARQ